MADKKDQYYYALGRRKSSTARIRLQGGKGTITINDKPAAEYFAGSKPLLAKLEEPFAVLQLENKFDISVHVRSQRRPQTAPVYQALTI
jgi:small subunit ribosomal protein S9